MEIATREVQVHVASVSANKKINSRFHLLSFPSPFIACKAAPGQFLMVSFPECRDPFLPRPFAIYDVVDDSFVEVLYKKVGKGTTSLAGKHAGDALQITGPLGRGFSPPKGGQRVVVVAGGTGIASVHFLMKHSLRRGHEVHLLYGVSCREEIVPHSQLDALGVRLTVATEDGSLGYHGKVSELLVSFLESAGSLSSEEIIAYVCGPSAMMAAVAAILTRYGISGQFSLESFMACGYGVCQGCVVETTTTNEARLPSYDRVCTEGPVFSLDDIAWDRLS